MPQNIPMLIEKSNYSLNPNKVFKSNINLKTSNTNLKTSTFKSNNKNKLCQMNLGQFKSGGCSSCGSRR